MASSQHTVDSAPHSNMQSGIMYSSTDSIQSCIGEYRHINAALCLTLDVVRAFGFVVMAGCRGSIYWNPSLGRLKWNTVKADVIVKAGVATVHQWTACSGRERWIDSRHRRANGGLDAEYRHLNLGLLKYCKWTQSFRGSVLFTLGEGKQSLTHPRVAFKSKHITWHRHTTH